MSDIPELKEDDAPAETEQVEDLAQEVQEVAAETADAGPSKFAGFSQLLAARWTRLKEFTVECKRVLRVTKKPDREELKVIVKVSGIGMIVIGAIGFLVHFFKELL